MENVFKIEITLEETEEGSWAAGDPISGQSGIADTILGAIEEWYYGFVYAIQESPPDKPSSDYRRIRGIHESELE